MTHTKYVPGSVDIIRVVTHWNSLIDHGLRKPCSYIIEKSGAYYQALKGSDGTIAFGGSADTGGAVGTDYIDVWQNVGDTLDTAGGGLIYFAEGTFTPTGATAIDPELWTNIHHRGVGMNATYLVGTSAGLIVKSGVAASNYVTFEDLTLDGDSQNNHLVNINTGATYWKFNRCHLTDSGKMNLWSNLCYDLTLTNNIFDSSAVAVSADLVALGSERCLVQGNRFYKTSGLGGGCLTSGSMKYGRIVNNYFENDAASSYAAVSLENNYGVFEDVVVSNNNILGEDSSGCINVGNAVTNAFIGATVSGNTIEGGGIVGNTVSRLCVTGNTIFNSHYGIAFANADSVSIIGNVIENTAYNGAGATGDKGGVYLSAPEENFVISNNVVIDTQGAGRETPYGISTDGSYGVISGNHIENADDGILLYGDKCNVFGNTMLNNAGFGLIIQAGATENHLHSNFYNGNTTNPVSDTVGANTQFDASYNASASLDLSGAATTLIVHHSEQPLRLMRACFLYTEASSADAGVGISIGNEGATNAFLAKTSEINKAQYYAKVYESDGAGLATASLATGDTITCTTAGGKADTGEVWVTVDCLTGAY